MKKLILLPLMLTAFNCLAQSSSSCSTSSISIDSSVVALHGISFFSPRSQSVNAARELVGWHPYIHQCKDDTYAVVTLTPEFTQSFRNARMAFALFGTDVLSITGSMVAHRDETDILADYFGLSPAYESEVTFDPEIRNVIVALNAFIGFNASLPGLYLTLEVPYVNTRWNLRPCETRFESGDDIPYPAGYMDEDAIFAPNCSFINALSCGEPFGQVVEPIEHGKFGGLRTKNAISDIEIALGYDFILRENGFAGLNIRCAIPTGTRPNSRFLFEPIVGNGKHWELGLGFMGGLLLWEKDGDQELNFFGVTNLTYMFNARQCRSFDFLCNGFGSRWLLLKEFDEDGNYTGETIPAINKTTIPVDVSMNLQMDLVIMFSYTYRTFLFDIGYNFYLRSAEKIHPLCQPDFHRFGIKGIQDVTFANEELSNTTQHCATLHGNYFVDQNIVADPNSPIFISNCPLDLHSGASPRILTQKLFFHIGGSFGNPCNRIIPFLGFGGEIEFEGINENNTRIANENTLSQWGVWMKVGAAFN